MSNANKQQIGGLGEGIACRFLVKKRFEIIGRNYWKKWGEIDIVAKKKNVIHFVEVKTVTRENSSESTKFSRVTMGEYRPEENVHPKKLERLRRVIQSYLLENERENANWQFDVFTVGLSLKDKTAHCRLLEDVVL